MSAAPSPNIDGIEWGSVHTSIGTFRDAKLWPGGGRGWDWNETGTHHTPGVQAADVVELLAHGTEIVVIGRGRHGSLEVMAEALDLIAEREAEAVVLETTAAVDRYNELAAEGARVGALIHSTC